MARHDITGFILAGGQSRRMRQDKSRIPWGDGTLLSHACDRMRQVASKVFVVGGSQNEGSPVGVLPDAFPGRGPLAGVHSALRHSDTDWNLVLAVDLPLVSVGILRFLADLSKPVVATAVAIRVGGRIQPLCAAYNQKLIGEVEQRLKRDDVSLHRLLERSRTRIIEEQEFLAAGFSSEMLVNVNTPEDLERARRLEKTLHV